MTITEVYAYIDQDRVMTDAAKNRIYVYTLNRRKQANENKSI
jgi:hypothetical protein